MWKGEPEIESDYQEHKMHLRTASREAAQEWSVEDAGGIPEK